MRLKSPTTAPDPAPVPRLAAGGEPGPPPQQQEATGEGDDSQAVRSDLKVIFQTDVDDEAAPATEEPADPDPAEPVSAYSLLQRPLVVTCRTVLITGGNRGIGFDAARQLALGGWNRIILACRDPTKAAKACQSLQAITNKNVFEWLPLDASSLQSCILLAEKIQGPIQCIILNHGELDSRAPTELSEAAHPLVSKHHVVHSLSGLVLVSCLIKKHKHKLASIPTIVYVASEEVCGVPKMGINAVVFPTSQESLGEKLIQKPDGSNDQNALAKATGALMWAGFARTNPTVNVVSVSPGYTPETDYDSAVTGLMKFARTARLYSQGLGTDVRDAAERYLMVANDPNSFNSGGLYTFDPDTSELVEQPLQEYVGDHRSPMMVHNFMVRAMDAV